MDIVKYIPRGKENAVTRMALRLVTGLSDRKVRQEIEEARAEGAIICNDQDGKGYYLPENNDEIYRMYKQDRHRALSILRRQKTMRKTLKDAGYLL